MDTDSHDDPTPPQESKPEPQPEPDPQPQPQTRPARRRRRTRPNGRWTNPASPLQAARFEHRLNGLDVIKAIRRICPGHAGEPCKIDVAKLSDYETGNRRMGLTHVEAFARFYKRSPEALGLIKWRDTDQEDPDAPPSASDLNPAHAHVVVIYVRAPIGTAASTVANHVLRALSQLGQHTHAPAEDDDEKEDTP